MNLVELASSKHQIVAVMDGHECPAFDFLIHGEATTESNRRGLVKILEHVAEVGLQEASQWVHEANKEHGIYEFIKGRLRLFFFKGNDGQIAVCTAGVLKKGQKADKAAVKKAADYKRAYFSAYADNQLKVVDYGAE